MMAPPDLCGFETLGFDPHVTRRAEDVNPSRGLFAPMRILLLCGVGRCKSLRTQRCCHPKRRCKTLPTTTHVADGRKLRQTLLATCPLFHQMLVLTDFLLTLLAHCLLSSPGEHYAAWHAVPIEETTTEASHKPLVSWPFPKNSRCHSVARPLTYPPVAPAHLRRQDRRLGRLHHRHGQRHLVRHHWRLRRRRLRHRRRRLG